MNHFKIPNFFNSSYYLFIICFATLFTLLYDGYNFGLNDHAIYVPYLQSLIDSSLYHRDLMVQTWRSVYFGELWKSLALLDHFISLQLLFFLLHLLTRFFFFLGIFFLLLSVSNNKSIGLLGVLLWIFPKPSLGFDIFYYQFGQSEIGITFLLFALIGFFQNRYLLSAVLIAISFYIHPPMAGFLTVCIAFNLFARKNFKQLILFFCTIFFLAFPMIYPVFLFTKNRTGYDTTWLKLTMLRSPHHSFPYLWSVHTIWMPYLLYTLISLISFWFIRKYTIFPAKKYILLLVPMYSIIAAGIVFSEIYPIPKIIAMVPFHISPLLSILLSLPTIFLFSNAMNQRKITHTTITCYLVLLYFFSSFSLSITSFEYIFIFLLLIIEMIIIITKWNANFVKNTFLPLLIGYLIFIKTPQLIYAHSFQQNNFLHDWNTTQIWANQHSDKNALFLTPTYLEGFQVFSHRAIFADWKEGTIGYLSPEYLREWWKRMQLLGLNQKEYSYSYQKFQYQHLGEQKVLLLAKQYHIQYVITENLHNPYTLKQVYINRHFIIYKI